MKKISWADFSRRQIMKMGTAAAVTGAMTPMLTGEAFAAAEDDRIIASAKKTTPNATEVTGILWSNYQRAMQPVIQDFGKMTGITMPKIQDISIFDTPQRAMAEALSKSPEFDFFHLDSTMIPSLASAGLLEPLDPYFEAAGFKINAVGNFGRFQTYKGKTYGVITDGNVHVQFTRNDLFSNPDEQKAFADKNGKELKWADTWEEDLENMKFFHRPDQDIWGTASLRDRGSSMAWFYMYLYSAGGFPFDDDGNPTIDTDAGEYAAQTYLDLKAVAHPEAAGWGTPQMIPRIVNGQAYSCQYWDGIIALAENPNKSKTTGKWAYGPVPGSTHSGKLLKRSVSTNVASVVINRHSPRKEAMAHLAMYLGTSQNSSIIVGDPVNTFHDPWHVDHFKPNSLPEKTYTQAGMQAIQQNLTITTPGVYLTGLLEFETELKRNMSEAYAGDKTAKQVVQDTQAAWAKAARRIGKRRLKGEMETYKSLMPTNDLPI